MRSVIIILLLQFTGAILAQDTAAVHTYGGNSFEDARCIVPALNGGFILAGTSGSQQESTTNAYVLKVDEDLNCIWFLNHGGFGVEKLSDVVQDAFGNIIVVGYASIVPDSGYDVLVLKINAGGELIWQRNLGGAGWEFADDVAIHPNGGYLIAGKRMNGLNADDALLYYIDSNGEVLNELNWGGDFDDAIHFLAVHDSVIYACGGLGISDSTQLAWSVQLNLNLDVIGADTVFTYSNSSLEYMDFHGDTVFTLGTYAIDSLGVRGSFFSRKESGNTIWSLDAYNFEAREIRFNNQLIYLPGTNSFFGLGGAAASICLLTENGNFVDCPSFGDIGDEGFYAMSFKDEIPVLVGNSNSYSEFGDNDVYVVMLSDSMVYGNYTLDIHHEDCFALSTWQQVDANQPSIKILQGGIQVEWNHHPISAELFDLLGNRLDFQTNQRQVFLSTSAYPCNIYVLRITANNNVVSQKIFLCGQ